MLYLDGGALRLLEVETGRTRTVLELGGGALINDFSLAPDNRAIYFNRFRSEFDIWMVELE